MSKRWVIGGCGAVLVVVLAVGGFVLTRSSGDTMTSKCRAQVVAELGDPPGIAWGPSRDMSPLDAMTLVATTTAGPRMWWCSRTGDVVTVQPVSGP